MADLFITDYYGHQVKVTDLTKAIEQAVLCADSPYIMTHYNTDNYSAIPESKQITIGAYYKDMLPKLENLKQNQARR